MEKKDVEDAIAVEKAIARNYDRPAADGATWFEVLPGSARVLVVAGHSTSQRREGSRKPADAGTGSLAVMLHRHACATVLYATYASPSDPNFYDDEFKERLALLIAREKPALVLDLHASHPYRPYDVDFGTMGGASLLGNRQWLDALADSLRREGIRNFSQDRFGASKNRTVTRFVAAAGVPAVQLEINSTWLLPPCSADGCAELDGLQPQRFAQMLEGLSRFIGAADAALGAPTCPGRPPE